MKVYIVLRAVDLGDEVVEVFLQKDAADKRCAELEQERIKQQKADFERIGSDWERYGSKQEYHVECHDVQDGFVQYSGGGRPVSESTRVTIVCRGGESETATAGSFYWGIDNEDYDIVSYRVEDN